MAEGGGFEPPEGVNLQQFSRPPQSAALPSLRRPISWRHENGGASGTRTHVAAVQRRSSPPELWPRENHGRSGGDRTRGPLLPKQVRCLCATLRYGRQPDADGPGHDGNLFAWLPHKPSRPQSRQRPEVGRGRCRSGGGMPHGMRSRLDGVWTRARNLFHFPPPFQPSITGCPSGAGKRYRPSAHHTFAYPGVVPAFSASSCCPALRLTLAPRAVCPRVLPGHSPGLCLSPSLPSRAFPLHLGLLGHPPSALTACGLPSSVLVGNVHRGRLVVLWAVARVPGLSRCA